MENNPIFRVKKKQQKHTGDNLGDFVGSCRSCGAHSVYYGSLLRKTQWHTQTYPHTDRGTGPAHLLDHASSHTSRLTHVKSLKLISFSQPTSTNFPLTLMLHTHTRKQRADVTPLKEKKKKVKQKRKRSTFKPISSAQLTSFGHRSEGRLKEGVTLGIWPAEDWRTRENTTFCIYDAAFNLPCLFWINLTFI